MTGEFWKVKDICAFGVLVILHKDFETGPKERCDMRKTHVLFLKSTTPIPSCLIYSRVDLI